jgi:hypothetical protein
MLGKPKLEQCHIDARFAWAQEQVGLRHDWSNVIWSDEKKFNLDGPDGYQFYWHDLRKSEVKYSRRVHGGGGVMIWGCFGYGGLRLVPVSGKINAAHYQDLLETDLLPFAEDLGGPNWIFQQDNASIHRAETTRQWFARNNVTVLPWPDRSPDMNPMENVWSLIVRLIYQGVGQYNSIGELSTALINASSKGDVTILQKLIDRMPNRVAALLAENGRTTK